MNITKPYHYKDGRGPWVACYRMNCPRLHINEDKVHDGIFYKIMRALVG